MLIWDSITDGLPDSIAGIACHPDNEVRLHIPTKNRSRIREETEVQKQSLAVPKNLALQSPFSCISLNCKNSGFCIQTSGAWCSYLKADPSSRLRMHIYQNPQGYLFFVLTPQILVLTAPFLSPSSQFPVQNLPPEENIPQKSALGHLSFLSSADFKSTPNTFFCHQSPAPPDTAPIPPPHLGGYH